MGHTDGAHRQGPRAGGTAAGGGAGGRGVTWGRSGATGPGTWVGGERKAVTSTTDGSGGEFIKYRTTAPVGRMGTVRAGVLPTLAIQSVVQAVSIRWLFVY